MAINVVMPALEMAQETGKLVAWLKQEGDTIAKGELLLEVETDKAVVEIESPGDGILGGIRIKSGEVVPVGETIAWILSAGEAVPAATVPAEFSARGSSASPPAARPAEEKQPAPVQQGATKISPKARGLLREHGIEASTVRGSGPEGTITAEDVLAFVAAQKTSPPAKAAAISSIARLMAERTTESWSTVPHFFLTRDVDAEQLIAARTLHSSTFEQDHGVRYTHTDSLVKLVATTLKSHPKINASWINDSIRLNADVNVAIAMAVEDGVVTGVIPQADKLAISAIAKLRHELTAKARAGRLRTADVANGTFTISNLGMYGIDSFTAIITPPQAAILAVGRIAERVVVIAGKPAVRPVMTLTLSVDHRVADGARGAAFLDALADAIRNPQEWLA
jgi:pyruvate dehydrogenase E2 component (dihydrolipoamide acetyltransferase)